MIIRGEKTLRSVILTPTKEIHDNSTAFERDSIIDEECRKAFQKGMDEGEKTGYKNALNDLQTSLNLLHAISNKLLEQKKHLLEKLKPEIVEFSIKVSERIVRKELGQPDVMATLINSLLNVCAPKFRNEILHITLSPEDLVMLENHLNHIQYDSRETAGIAFHSDPLIKRGDCRIDATSGVLNYSIARELGNLQTKILQSVTHIQ